MGPNAESDHEAKPFSYPELRARVAAVLRRPGSRRRRSRVRIGPLTIDPAPRRALLDEQPIELSAKEYEVLVALANDPHRVLTRVNFELRPKEGEQGIQGLGRRLGDPLSPGTLAA
jgi:DNA-binding response OmpR family regulator